ncbi:MAG TPA: DUF4126 domain-containing protein [Longimicrobiales bacterium]
MTGAPFVLFGQLLGLAFAAGLNLYATVAILGLAGQLGLISALPPPLRGLEHPIVVVSAGVLYLVEFVVDKVPKLDTIWDTLHTVIRPAAATTLTVAALGDAPFIVSAMAGASAGAIALLAHGTKAGIRVTLLGGRGAGAHAAASVTEDLLAVALAGAALSYPQAALALVGAAIAATLPLAPRLSRAFTLGARGALAFSRGLFFGGHWRETREMPRDLRALLDPQEFGFGNPAAARVAVRGLPGVGAYRNGWLVLAGDRLHLLFRRRFRARSLLLPPGDVTLRRGFWADRATIQAQYVRYDLFFLKDGPAPELALSELAGAAAGS